MRTAQINGITIPRGSTARGVNARIINFLLEQNTPTISRKILFDIPCGKGEFLNTVQQFFPQWSLKGGDLFCQDDTATFDLCNMDAAKEWTITRGDGYDYITSMSGLIEFDNTSGFIKECARYLKNDGTLILSNDNHLTVLDRLFFLAMGSKRMFPLLLGEFQPTYKDISLSEIQKILIENDLTIKSIKYTHLLLINILLSPLAVIIYLVQTLCLLALRKNYNNKYRLFPKKNAETPGISWQERLRLFSFASLFYAHYILYIEKHDCAK